MLDIWRAMNCKSCDSTLARKSSSNLVFIYFFQRALSESGVTSVDELKQLIDTLTASTQKLQNQISGSFENDDVLGKTVC